MASYDASDIKSTLVYIKDRFGADIFTKTGRIPALLSDLAPKLKNERIMIERLSRLGILEDFAANTYEDDAIKKRIISKAMTQLTKAEFIMPSVAATYISIIAEVFTWKIDIEIPREANNDKMKFDSQRYARESQDRSFCAGKKAFESENYTEAKLMFEKAYSQGNVLAGVLLGTMYYSGNGCERNYAKAVQLFVDGMQHDCPLGAEWLAAAYKWGRAVPQDKEKAKEIFLNCEDALDAMCASGSTDAQYVYGFDLLYGNFCAVDEKKALYWLQTAMDAGHASASVHVALMHLNGWGIEKDPEKAMQILNQYEDAKNKLAQFELGKIYYFGEVRPQDYSKALHHFKKAAERGHAKAQDFVGDIYYYGKGIQVDYSEARKWYEKSECQGNKDAALSLGFIYHYGEGVSVDKQKAFKYFKTSADKGVARAQYMLHYYYLFDEKYKDYAIGIQLLEKAAEQGDVLAQKLLARCYIGGSFDLAEDDNKFVYWMRKAAEQQDAEAERILGEAYIKLDNDKALPKSYPDAISWLKKGAEKGDIKAHILLAEIYATVDEYLDEQQFLSYADRAESLMLEQEKHGVNLCSEHESLADLYYNAKSNKVAKQKAYDHYCYAFQGGQTSALYDLAWMYFVNGYDTSFFKKTPEELIQILIEENDKTQSSNLAYLLGLIYFNGYRIKADKQKAENWYTIAMEKGSLSAACKLGFYYVNEKRMYDKGFSVINQAHEKGSVEATRLLGLCYKTGIGVKKSRSKAKALLKEAAEKGDEDAKAELKKFMF